MGDFGAAGGLAGSRTQFEAAARAMLEFDGVGRGCWSNVSLDHAVQVTTDSTFMPSTTRRPTASATDGASALGDGESANEAHGTGHEIDQATRGVWNHTLYTTGGGVGELVRLWATCTRARTSRRQKPRRLVELREERRAISLSVANRRQESTPRAQTRNASSIVFTALHRGAAGVRRRYSSRYCTRTV
jgi:hypothetical protein